MKYLLNLTPTNLSVNKYQEIAPGKYGTITDAEAESPEVIYAVRAKWASVHDTVPGTLEFETPKMEFETPATQGNMTLDEAVVEEGPAVEVQEEVVEETAEEAKPVRGRKSK